MNKLWLIIRREYLTRVRKRTFVLATILTPLAMGLIIFVSVYFASNSDNSVHKILIKDHSGLLEQKLDNTENITFFYTNEKIEQLKKDYIDKGFDMLVVIPKLEDLTIKNIDATFYTKDKPSLMRIEGLERRISLAIEQHKLEQSPIDKETIEALNMAVTLENGNRGNEDSEGDNSSKLAIGISTGLSYFMGFLMYMVIFIYGMMVMRSVMEEKINRIVEVMISSVRPFYLMLGKIIGVGLVGLTQLAIWMILLPLIAFGVSAILGLNNLDVSAGETLNPEIMEQAKNMSSNAEIQNFIIELKNMNWLLIIPTFVIFFFGGYFIYSSLFAAVGSAIGDDLGEGQQFTLPIVIPVIIAMIMIPSVFNDPDGKIAVFGSMFPLFSPIIMPARLPFDPPFWQIIVSILLLLAAVVFFAWLAGRIYRVGIFMYGKKVNFKELSKWIMYKG